MPRRFEAARGLLRVASSYAVVPLVRAVAAHGPTPLALLAATARRHPTRVAWRDARGDLTYADVVAELIRRRPRPGPVVVRQADPRELVLDVVAAVVAGRGVAVLGGRGGSTAAEAPPRRGVSFLSTGTTGAPQAHGQVRRVTALRPHLGLAGRLPRLRTPLVGSPSSPDHGHAFLLVMLTWALGGTYVQITGPTGRLDVLSGVPLQLADLLDHGWCEGARIVVSGSDVLSGDLADRLGAAYGARVWNAYGATETGPISLADPADVAAGTVGLPLPGVSVRTDGDRLVVRTPATTRPFTGDRGRLDERGRIVWQGRADGRHVSGGEVVDPGRLRSWLEAQPGVSSVRVTLVPDDRFGARLAAEVSGAVAEDPDALRDRIRSELGPAHVPGVITLRAAEPGLGQSDA